MKNKLNKSRLSMLANIAWYEDVRRPLLGLLISMGIMLSVFIILIINNSGYSPARPYDPMLEVQEGFFWVALFIFAAYSGTLVGNCFSTKPKAISALMLPASQAEKFWFRWTIFVPLFFIAFAVGALAVDFIRYSLVVLFQGSQCGVQLGITHLNFDEDFWMILLMCVAAQSFFVLGGTVWPKRGLILTALTYFIYGWAFTFFMIGIAYMTRDSSIPYITDHLRRVSRLDATAIVDAFAILTSVVNYALAYLRTKEMEIIQRW